MSDKISEQQMERILKITLLQKQLLQEQIDAISNGNFTPEEKLQQLANIINPQTKDKT